MPQHACQPALPLPRLESFPMGLDGIYRVVLSFGDCRAFLGWEALGRLCNRDDGAGTADLPTQIPKNSWHHQLGGLGVYFWVVRRGLGCLLQLCMTTALCPMSQSQQGRTGTSSCESVS